VLSPRIARISAEAAWVVAGQALAFLGNVAAIKILTNQLGPDAYGRRAPPWITLNPQGFRLSHPSKMS